MEDRELEVYRRIIKEAVSAEVDDTDTEALLARLQGYGISTDPLTLFAFLSSIDGFECQECHYAPPARCWVTQQCKYCSSNQGLPIIFEGEQEMVTKLAELQEWISAKQEQPC